MPTLWSRTRGPVSASSAVSDLAAKVEGRVERDIVGEPNLREVIIPVPGESFRDLDSVTQHALTPVFGRRCRIGKPSAATRSASMRAANLPIGAYVRFPRATTPSPLLGCQRMCDPKPGYPPEWKTERPYGSNSSKSPYP